MDMGFTDEDGSVEYDQFCDMGGASFFDKTFLYDFDELAVLRDYINSSSPEYLL
jgi:hypothetical protein